jgi:hypothetical protein
MTQQIPTSCYGYHRDGIDEGTFQLIYLSQERGLNAIVIRSCDAINIFYDKASVRVCLLKVNNKSAVTDRKLAK